MCRTHRQLILVPVSNEFLIHAYVPNRHGEVFVDGKIPVTAA